MHVEHVTVEVRHIRSVSLQQIVLRGGAVSGGGVLTARGRGEVFAAIVVKYFSRRIIRKGTRNKKNTNNRRYVNFKQEFNT